MTYSHFLSAFGGFAIAFLTLPAYGKDLTLEMDRRHKACLEQIAEDADLAFEEAMIWRGDGGGRRAKHCEAMALYALGHAQEAAHRLNQLAEAPDGGSDAMRVTYYAEAANFWLSAHEAEQAYHSATAGLKLMKDDVLLRIARARAYALLERFDYAEIDLTSALVFEPDNAEALRYRADARLRQEKLQAAKKDIDKSLLLDPSRVETALLRGQILEAIRLSDTQPTQATTP